MDFSKVVVKQLTVFTYMPVGVVGGVGGLGWQLSASMRPECTQRLPN